MRFLKSKSGIAAVEFAIIAPVVVLLFFGLIEVSQGVNCRQRMESVTSTVADLVSQSAKVTNADRDNIFNAANAVMYPFAASNMEIVVSSLVEDGANPGKGKVVWSDATPGGTARTVGASVSDMPTGLITAGGSVIMSEVTYIYTSPSTYVINQPITMKSRFYSRPRRSVQVTRSAT